MGETFDESTERFEKDEADLPPPEILAELRRRLARPEEPREDGAEEGSAFATLRRLEERAKPSDRYRVLEEIARGGQGAILRVWDEDLHRTLAMKAVLRGPAATERGSQTLGRFLDEAQVTGQLDHPGIVPVHDLGIDPDGRVYFTMKLVRGRDLREIYRLVREEKDGWTKVRALNVLLKACEALSYAHDKGVIHRDLKPGNIMVGKYGEVLVMDWGLARVVDMPDTRDLRVKSRAKEDSQPLSASQLLERVNLADDSPLVTMDGDVVGTPAYMPPEQAAGEIEAMGPHSDVYSMGALLYELVSGHRPYVPPGLRVNNYAIWYQVQVGPPRPLSEVAPGESPELVAICEKAMARDPRERYRDMSELAEDLSAFLHGRVVHAYEAGPKAELRKWIVRNRGLSAAIAATVVSLVGGLATVGYVQHGRALLAEELAEDGRSVLRLSAFRVLDGLEREAESLWPAHPDMKEPLRAWLARAHELIAGLDPDPETGDPGHLGQLEVLRARGTPPAAGEHAARPHVVEATMARGDEAWRFAEEEDAWWYDQLTELVAAIRTFADEETGLVTGLSPWFGQGVARRLAFAETIEERSVSGPEAARRWREARAAVRAHPDYGGLVLRPQLGLLPIGPDPASGLWEFWHLQTGEEPRRDAEGRLVRTGAMGIVFVLLPGGTFLMGSQSTDPAGPNYYAEAAPNESPVHEVTLSPFFVSKYELTQGQWERFAGANPSAFGPDSEEAVAGLPHSPLTPVDDLSWDDAQGFLARLGLALPTEAQWEYAARAGSSTPWWTGETADTVAAAANLADRTAGEHTSTWVCEPWDDGYYLQAEVGSFAANAFGLHDVLGNLFEWCLDGYDERAYGAGAPRNDPLVDPASRTQRVGRGGDYNDVATISRSAHRNGGPHYFHSPRLGGRAARPLDR